MAFGSLNDFLSNGAIFLSTLDNLCWKKLTFWSISRSNIAKAKINRQDMSSPRSGFWAKWRSVRCPIVNGWESKTFAAHIDFGQANGQAHRFQNYHYHVLYALSLFLLWSFCLQISRQIYILPPVSRSFLFFSILIIIMHYRQLAIGSRHRKKELPLKW